VLNFSNEKILDLIKGSTSLEEGGDITIIKNEPSIHSIPDKEQEIRSSFW
jgi:hypothetical protein